MRDEVIGALCFCYHSAPVIFVDAQIDFAIKVAASVSLALENARLYAAQKSIADTLQEALLAVPQKIEGIEFGHLYRSATERARLGADFYDLFELERGRVGIAIGDVSIKGLEVTALTSLVKNAIKAYAYEGISPASVIAKTNEMVAKMPAPSLFATGFFGILDTKTGSLVYCSAGHPPAIHKRKTLEVELCITGSPVIGAFAGLNYIDDEVVLEKGDALILYTNGVTAARRNGEFFGEEKLVRFIRELTAISAKEVPQIIFEQVMDCTGGKLLDDIALLVVSLDQ